MGYCLYSTIRDLAIQSNHTREREEDKSKRRCSAIKFYGIETVGGEYDFSIDVKHVYIARCKHSSI